MADSKVIEVTLRAVADMKDVASNIEQIKKGLSGLVLPKGLESQFTRLFSNLESNIEKANNKLAAGFKSKGDASSYEKITNQIVNDLTNMSQLMGRIDTSKLNFQVNADALKTINQDIATLQSKLDSLRTEKLDGLQKIREAPPSGAAAWKNFFDAIDKGTDGVEDAEKALKVLQQQVERATRNAGGADKLSQRWKDYASAVEVCKQALGLYNGENKEVASLEGEIVQKTREREQATIDANINGKKSVEGLVEGTKKINEEEKEFVKNSKDSANAQASLNSELDQFKSRISYFFGMNNAVRLFQRALRATFNTIKDLDKVMTETAVVTEFDVGDMWSQLPEYTERANKLGITIHDAYEAATLYYQQGLSTNEVMAVSNETLKMARIAGLQAAEATDRMTNALRGFNMELTESNAQNINDVYSNLAAKTASNVDEISTAMTKVASLANNANMSFENTAAFLSQIIETTRESAETAGTALKTVIARFSEVKKLYSEGELLGTDEEGQEINVNKVSEALRTAGINLNEYLTGMKGLDEIFMELSAKWDTLDQVQQRYIATMAAGSRQQSRFIALMQDNARMTELVGYANNAAGASEQQFEKTLESLESKLNQLKNTWNTFLMGIANSDVIKGAVDLLTGLLNVLNKISKDMPGIGKSFTNILMLVAGFKIGRGILTKIFPSLAPAFSKIGLKGGVETAVGWGTGFKKGILANGGGIKGAFNTLFTKTSKGVGQELSKNMQREIVRATSTAKTSGKINLNQQNEILTTFKTEGYEAAQAKAKSYGTTLENVSDETKAYGQEVKVQTLNLGNLGNAFMGLGGALMLVSRLFDDGTESGKKAAKIFTILGGVIMGLGVVLKIAGTIAEIAGIKITASAKAAGTAVAEAGVKATIGWLPFLGIVLAITAALAALTFVVVKLVKVFQGDKSAEKNLKKAKKATEQAQKAAQNAKEAYDNLNSSINEIKDKYSAIEELTRGTREWRDAVQEVNSEVLELIGTYQGLAGYVTTENGVLKIDFSDSGVQDIINEYADNIIKTSSAAIQAQKNENSASLNVGRDKVLTSMGWQWGDKETNLIAKALAGDVEAVSRVGIDRAGQTDAEYLQQAAEKMGYSLAADWPELIEEAANDLKEYGKDLLQSGKQLEGYNDILAENAATLAGLEGQEKEYAGNFLNDERLSQLYDEALANQEDVTKRNRRKKRDEYAQTLGYNDYAAYTEAGGKELSDKELKQQLAWIEATDKAAIAAEHFVSNLESASDVIKRVYAREEGGALTRGDLDKDLGEVVLEDYEASLGKAYEDFTTAERLAFETFKANQVMTYGGDWEAAQKYAEERFAQADNRLRQVSAINLSNVDVDSETYSDLVDNILTIVSTSGRDAARSFKTSFDDVIKGMSPEQVQEFTSALNSIDWSDASQVEGLKGTITDFGVAEEKADDFIQTIISGMDRINVAPLEEVLEKLDKASSIAKKIDSGDQKRSFSKEDYEAIISAVPDFVSSFVQDSEGNFTYIGDSMGDLAIALRDNTAALLDDTTKRTEANLDAGAILEELSGREGWEEDASTADQRSLLAEFLKDAREQGVDLSAMGIEGLGNGSEAFNFTPDDLARIINELGTVLGNFRSDIYAQEQEREGTEGAAAQARGQTAEQNASMVNTEYGDEYAKALQAEVQLLEVADEYVSAYTEDLYSLNEAQRQNAADKLVSLANTQKEIDLYDLETEEVKQFAEQLANANKELDPATALRTATALTRMERGYKSLSDSYEDWIDLIDESGKISKKTTASQVKTFNELKNSVKDLLAVSDDLPDSFFESVENMELLKQAVEGDLDALQKLRVAAAQEYAIEAIADLNTDEFSQQLAEFYNWCASIDLPNLEAGAYLNNDPYLNKLHEILTASNATAEQLRKFFDNLGFDIQYEWKDITVTAPRYAPDPNVPLDGRAPTIVQRGTDTLHSKARLPKFVFKGSSVNANIGGGGGGTGRGSSGGSGGGSGGSGSGSKEEKPTYWENPYDELFNLQEKINEALRTREKLERQYQKTLKLTTTSIADIRQGYTEIIDHLKQEIQYQKQLAQGRKKQIEDIGSEIYVDEEGNRKTYSEMGVTKYASYDFSSGLLQIDWEGLEAITKDSSREEEGKAAEAYINYLQELVDQFEETDETIVGIQEEIEDLQQEAIDSYIEFEERVYDAVISKYEEQIEQFEKLSDAIKDSMDDVIKGIQDQIAAQRQARENERTEESIAEKEARLAYLQRDTSGANATEILKLQDELSKAREDYQDSLIDQAIDQMQKDADLAAEQRANQISIMQEQLELEKSSGNLWSEVYALINGATGKDGTLSQNSELVALLKDTENFDAMSAFGQDEWKKDLVEKFNNAQKGLAAGNANKAGQHQNTATTQKPATTTTTTKTSSSSSSQSTSSSGSKAPTLTDEIKKHVAAAIWNGNYGWGTGDTRRNRLTEVFGANNGIQALVNQGIGKNGISPSGYSYTDMRKKFKGYKTGGLADYTGPAWLDGTKSKPEMVLNAEDTKNLITLKDILAASLGNASQGKLGYGDNYFDIKIDAEIGSDYDVDQLANKIKKQIQQDGLYRNVNSINHLR